MFVTSPYDSELQRLISERRGISHSGLPASAAKARRIALGKQIQNRIMRKRGAEETEQIRIIVSESRSLGRLSSLLAPPKSKGIVEMRDGNGIVTHDKGDIAEVVASFYEDLCRSRSTRRFGRL